MYKVVERLKMIIAQSNISTDYYHYQNKSFDCINDQILSECIALNSNDSSSHGKLSQIIQNFDKMDTKEIIGSLMISNEQSINKEISSKNDLNTIVDEIVSFIFKKLIEGKLFMLEEKPILDFLDNQDIVLHEIYSWLSNNQSNLNSIFLLGYFNFFGIETSKNYEKAFDIFINASEQNHILAQFYIGTCYQYGHGVTKDEKTANEYFGAGELNIGYCYENGIGIEKNSKMAVYWYEKAANNENQMAQYNLANIYCNGDGIDKNMDKIF